MATYNMAEYLPLAVRSVLQQTYRDVEVIVIDDGSTDDTTSVMAPMLDDSRIRFQQQENRGQASAKNLGIRLARGEYVAFLDADDLWLPEKLELQMPLFGGPTRPGVVYARMLYIDEAGRELRMCDDQPYRGRVSGELLVRNFIGFGTSVVRKECFDRLGGFRENLRMGIDYDVWLRFSSQFAFDYVDRPLLLYRIWPGQMSADCKGRFQNGIEIMRRFLEEFPGLVDAKTQDEAWAHTYVGLARCLQGLGVRRGPLAAAYAKALRFKPMCFDAWRGILTALFAW